MKRILLLLSIIAITLTGNSQSLQFGNQIKIVQLIDSMPSSVNISAQDLGSTTLSYANGQNVYTGTPTVNSFAAFSLSGKQSLRISTSGTWTGTVISEGSLDGALWTNISVHQSGTPYNTSTFTNNLIGVVNVSGLNFFRLRSTSVWTGTCVVKVTTSMNGAAVYVINGTTIQDGTIPTQKVSVNGSGALKVDNSGVTQPISAASLPLPTGSATAANQTTTNTSLSSINTNITNGSQRTQINDGIGNIITSTNVGGKQRLDVTLAAGATAGATAPTIVDQVGGVDGSGFIQPLQMDAVKNLKVAADINKIGGTNFSLGQKDKTASLSVSLAPQYVNDSNVIGQSAQTAVINNILTQVSGANATDVNGYHSAFVQVNSTGTGGTYIFEFSNDNAIWLTQPVTLSTLITGNTVNGVITPSVSNISYVFTPLGRYIRLRIATTITGGSIQAISRFCQPALTPHVFNVGQNNAANLSMNAQQWGGTNVVSGGVAGMPAIGGNIAHSAASTSNPVQSGGRVVPNTLATVDQTLQPGDIVYKPHTTANQAIIKPFGTAELDFNFVAQSAATTTTLQSIVPSPGVAGDRNYVTSITIQTDAIGAAGNAWILDGQGAIGTSVTIATPGVFTSAAHDLKVGDAIVFTSLGTITGVTTNTIYWITSTSFAATTFTVSTTNGGAAIAITGSTSAFTFYRVLYPLRIQTTAIASPVTLTFPTPLRGFSNAALNLLIPSSLTSGNIYMTINGYRNF